MLSLPAYLVAYLVLTAALWAGNRNVGIKRPLASATKWFVWTATWMSFSVMMMDLPPGALSVQNVVGPLVSSIFVYPMILLTPTDGTTAAGLALLWSGPWIAASIGYALAVGHNGRIRSSERARPKRG